MCDAVHRVVVRAPMAQDGGDLAAGLVGGAVVLLIVLLLLVGILIWLYRSECHQLRARNNQLSIENDRWHEDFAVQTGELAALRKSNLGNCGYPAGRPAEASWSA